MYRIPIKLGPESISVTPLTLRILLRAGRKIEVIPASGSDVEPETGFARFDWEDSVCATRELVDRWDSWSSAEIIERLDYLWQTQKDDVPKVDLDETLDLWVLKALAQEKGVYVELKDVEGTYRHCLHLGKWNAVLVRNNLGVLKARRQECMDALNSLSSAISSSLSEQIPLKAPFFNAALVFHHLHQAGLLTEPRYLDALTGIVDLIRTAQAEPQAGGAVTAEQSTSESINLEAAYREIADYGYYLREPDNPNLFQRNATCLIPDSDLFDSFGDVADRVDSRRAHEVFETGIAFSEEKRFDDAVTNFEIAATFDPAISFEVSERIDQSLEQWRQEVNQRVTDLLSRKKFDEAINLLSTLDIRLNRQGDDTLKELVLKRKHLQQLRLGKRLLADGDTTPARVLLIALLKEKDLEKYIRAEATNELTELLVALSDDNERHFRLSELIRSGADHGVIERCTDGLASRLTKEALTFREDGEYGQAIRKYCWALLLPHQGKSRTAVVTAAVSTLDLLLRSGATLAACTSLNEVLFEELKAEFISRWQANQDEAAAAKFERLDGEPWIMKKQIDELLRLLEELIERAPTTERLVNRLRLFREKEGQRLFGSIQEQLKLVAEEGEHSVRRDLLSGELRRLHDLATDFAASEHSSYAEQITEFVSTAETYLILADQRRFTNTIDLETNRVNEAQFQALRETLRNSKDEVKSLQAVCNAVNKLRETDFFEQSKELAINWFGKHAKQSLLELAVADPDQAKEALGSSIGIIEKNRGLLPEVFNNGFKDFLKNLLAEVEGARSTDVSAEAESSSSPEDDGPAEAPPFEPFQDATVPKPGFLRRILASIKSIFGPG